MTPVIVGGTGFVGGRVAERLGGAVLGSADVDLRAADAEDLLALRFEGAGAVVNLAGVLGRPSRSTADYRAVNAEGAARVARAARRASVPRLVHVSTTGVLGPTGREPVAESALPAPSNEYERSKLEGERAALSSRAPSFEVVVVRPGLVYGPGDRQHLPLFRAIARGTFRKIGGGAALWQPVHVDDVARAIGAAVAIPGVDGEVFHVAGGERLAIGDLAERIADALGTRIRRPSLPIPVALAAGAALEILFAPFGTDPPLSRARVRTLTTDRVYAIGRAAERLSWRPEIPLDRGLAETAAWYRERRLLS